MNFEKINYDIFVFDDVGVTQKRKGLRLIPQFIQVCCVKRPLDYDLEKGSEKNALVTTRNGINFDCIVCVSSDVNTGKDDSKGALPDDRLDLVVF